MLRTYAEFLALVNELGFFPFYGRFLPGFPMLQTETTEDQWHTGDRETDPWQWKDRAAEERQLAFGCILGGHKGFIAKQLYPLFYAACHSTISMEERYGRGELSQTAWQLHRLFAGGAVLSTAEIRQALGVTKKEGASQVDATLKELQKGFVITVCGNRRKVSLDGREYGWPANTYCRVTDWTPDGWLDGSDEIDPAEAREQLLDIGCSIAPSGDRQALSKVLFGRRSE